MFSVINHSTNRARDRYMNVKSSCVACGPGVLVSIARYAGRTPCMTSSKNEISSSAKKFRNPHSAALPPSIPWPAPKALYSSKLLPCRSQIALRAAEKSCFSSTWALPSCMIRSVKEHYHFTHGLRPVHIGHNNEAGYAGAGGVGEGFKQPDTAGAVS